MADPIAPRLKRPVRVVMSDLDGCVTGGEWRVDSGLLARLQEYAARAEQDPAVPRLTFNTGRPLPYAECLARLAHVTLPLLCESGVLLYDPSARSAHWHPDFAESDRELFAEAARLARLEPGFGERFFQEPGKMGEFTLLPRRGAGTAELVAVAERIAARLGQPVRIDATHAVVSLSAPHLDKGAGLAWFERFTAIDANEIASIGDSMVDWAFMRRTAASWVPRQGAAELRALATVASDSPPGEVLLEAFEMIIRANRRILGGSASAEDGVSRLR